MLPALPHAAAAGAKTAELPRETCATRIVDPENDAKYRINGSEAPSLSGTTARTNVVGTDITGVYLRVTADEVQAFMKVKDLPATTPWAPPDSTGKSTPRRSTEMPASDVAYLYVVSFKYENKLFKLQHQIVNNNWNTHNQAPATAVPIVSTTPVPTDENTFPKGEVGTPPATLAAIEGKDADFDAAKDFVKFTLPRQKVETMLDHAFVDGDKFTDIIGSTSVYTVSASDSDATAAPAASAVFEVGDDRCFGPPPATLSDLVLPPVQFSDTVTLSAKLFKEDGTTPLADKEVSFAVGTAAPVKQTTNAAGLVTAKYTAALPKGTYPVVVTYAGDATDGKAKATGSLVISLESTKFAALKVAKPSATSRVVTATLTDNDGKPVGAAKVDWYVNGKKLATVVTDSAGRSVYRGAKPTQTVQAKYVGLAGKHLGATSAKAKV